MEIDLAMLPTDVSQLHQLLRDAVGVIERQNTAAKARDLEIEKLSAIITKLRRMQFGTSSEKHDPDQLRLLFEAIEVEIGSVKAETPASADGIADTKQPKKVRRSFPDHLPRQIMRHEPEGCACPNCGGNLHQIGEDCSEILEYRPASFEVIRHVRPRFACRGCESITQMPAPSLPIPRGMAGPGLLAHLIVSKYADHLPLYRQSEIFARQGIDIERATMADWVGRCAWLLQPLGDRLQAHIFRAPKIHGDDTPLPVLSPGLGRTKKGFFWDYVADGRNSGDMTPPAVLFKYSPDRKGERPAAHLKGYRGYFQADAYSGFDRIYRGDIIEVGCWAHARRKFNDVFEKDKSPTAAEAIVRIGELYGIEKGIRGAPPDRRKSVRRQDAVPKLNDLKAWLETRRRQLLPESDMTKAINYTLNQWEALTRYVEDGRLEIDNNRAENAIRPITLGRKNYLFAGSDAGAERAAVLYSLLSTCKLNGVNPQAYLTDVLARIGDHPINRVEELLPWNWAAGQIC